MPNLRESLSIAFIVSVVLVFTSCGGSTKSTTPPPANPISVTMATPSANNVTAGGSLTVTASVANDSANMGLAWSLSCSQANCGSLSSTSGTSVSYTAPTSLSANLAVTIIAISKADSSKSASVALTITPAPVISVAITPSQAQSVAAAGTLQFSATVTNDSGNKGVTWSLSCVQALCGSLSSTSASSITYTAPASVAANLAVTLTATSVADSGKSATVAISVAPIVVIGVSVSPSTSQSVAAAGTLDFAATVTNDSGNKGVTWALSCSQAPCGSLSSTSANSITYTAPASVAANLSVTLTATSVADSSKSATVAITVTPVVVIGISVSPSTSQSVLVAGTLDFTASLTNDSGNKGVTWAVSCSQSDCGSLSGTTATATTYNAPANVAANLAVTLTATSVADASKSASVAITVTPPASPAALFKGQYGFAFNGFTDTTLNGPVARYSMIGSIIADGNGNITGGSAIVNSIYGEAQTTVTGTYTVSSDHRGTLCLTFADHSAFVSSNPYTFAFALANITNNVAGKGSFIEGDDASGSAQRGSGVFLRQNPASFQQSTITGGYAFMMTGESATQVPLGAGGVFTANGSGSISAGTGDFMTYAGAVSNAASIAGTYSAADATYGVVPLQLTIGSATATTPSNFAAVIIDSQQLLLMSTDAHATDDIYAGWAHLQAQPSYGDASLNGNFVGVGLTVQDVSSARQFESDLLQGYFNGAGSITVNVSDSNVSGVYAGNQSVGTYALNVGTNGRVTVGSGVALYLYDQNKGYYVNWHGGSAVAYGEFAPQDTSVTSLADLATPFIFHGEWSHDPTHPDANGVVSIDPAGPVSFTDDYAYQGPLQTMIAPYTATAIDANGRFTMLDQWNDAAQICYVTNANKVDCLNPTAIQPSITHIEK
jgi:hypothetical protein